MLTWADRIICLSNGLAPKSSMYLRDTPVCFFSAQAKMSFTTSAGTVSCGGNR